MVTVPVTLNWLVVVFRNIDLILFQSAQNLNFNTINNLF